jgi:hypothetical protein
LKGSQVAAKDDESAIGVLVIGSAQSTVAGSGGKAGWWRSLAAADYVASY